MTRTHHQNLQNPKIFSKFDPKKLQNRVTGGVCEGGDFEAVWMEFGKYFGVLGIFDGGRGHFVKNIVRFCRKKSKSKSTIAHCYLLTSMPTKDRQNSFMIQFKEEVKFCVFVFQEA
jgi:hypothetical protein